MKNNWKQIWGKGKVALKTSFLLKWFSSFTLQNIFFAWNTIGTKFTPYNLWRPQHAHCCTLNLALIRPGPKSSLFATNYWAGRSKKNCFLSCSVRENLSKNGLTLIEAGQTGKCLWGVITCEKANVSLFAAVQKPEKLSWVSVAAALRDGVCAYTALHTHARMAAGHTLLVMDGASVCRNTKGSGW